MATKRIQRWNITVETDSFNLYGKNLYILIEDLIVYAKGSWKLEQTVRYIKEHIYDWVKDNLRLESEIFLKKLTNIEALPEEIDDELMELFDLDAYTKDEKYKPRNCITLIDNRNMKIELRERLETTSQTISIVTDIS